MKKNDRGANCETQRNAYRYFSSLILYFICSFKKFVSRFSFSFDGAPDGLFPFLKFVSFRNRES